MRRLLALLVLVAGGAAAADARALVPNDPGWSKQWAQRQMRLPEVWDYTTGSPDVVIASVDTGVNPNIPDLQDALVPGWDFVDGDDQMQDEHGHGTVVASTMVARGGNGIAIAGYCWRCRVMPIRVASSKGADVEKIAAGIRFAVDRGVPIINVGFVHEQQLEGVDATIGAAVRYAAERGVLVVTSAGNTSGSARTYPGAYPGALPVAGTDTSDRLYDWSTRGSWVPLAAPGCQTVISAANEWGWLCGTSLTAPAVAGVAALALSLKRDLTPQQITRALVSTARPVDGIAGGRVDAYAALEFLGVVPKKRPEALPRAAASQRMQRKRAGTLRKRLRAPIRIGGGTLKVTLRSRYARECSLTVVGRGEVLLARRRSRTLLALTVRLPAGRYVVDVTCRTKRAKRYTLAIAAPRPATAAVSTGR